MVGLRSAAWGVLAAAAVAVGACGGPSDEEVRDERANFVREADALCDATIDKLARGAQPSTYRALTERMKRDEKTLRSANADLHELREKLGDSASKQVVAFDRRLDAVHASTRRIGHNAERRDARGTRRSATRLRTSYDALYRAAGAAKLRRCGRGGNKAADLALFTVYRDEFLTVTADVNLRLRGLQDNPQTPEAFRRYLHRSLPLVGSYRGRMGHLSPPQALRRSHRLLLRRTTRAVGTARRLLRMLDRGQLGGGVQLVAVRLGHQARLLDAADRAIRRILSTPGGRRAVPGPGATNAA
ncbi:MAG: hypothetical protein M3401_11525 [Actinomycetota bacterium]|nr:hypothetical protein [Actinomycetota bacterium]